MNRIFNFGAGPAMLPTAVMEKAQQEFLNYKNMGASVIEISHRSPEFDEIINVQTTLGAFVVLLVCSPDFALRHDKSNASAACVELL